MVFPVLVTITVGGWLLYRALQTLQPMDVALAVEGWIFIAVTWAGALWVARGTWQPLGESTKDFLDLSIRRCRANLRAVPLMLSLYLLQLVMVTLVAAWYSDAKLSALSTAWPTTIFGLVGLPLLIICGFWFARRQRERLSSLLKMQEELMHRP